MTSILHIARSKTRSAILEVFFSDTDKEYYLRQLERLTGYSVGNIRREMNSLEAGEFFRHRLIGKIKLYALNKENPIYNELKNIVRKTIGIEGSLKRIIEPYEGLRYAFIYGSFAKRKEESLSDLDIMIIGHGDLKAIKSALFEYQSLVRREINSIVYSEKEFLKKIENKNHFISTAIAEPKIFLKGKENEFRRFIQVRKAKRS